MIGARPGVALERREAGHFEGDLITGRASRHLWLADFAEDHGADATLAALAEVLERIPEALRRTLTWDQGREMARHADLAALVSIDIYFAEPVRHEALSNPAVVKGHGQQPVAAG